MSSNWRIFENLKEQANQILIEKIDVLKNQLSEEQEAFQNAAESPSERKWSDLHLISVEKEEDLSDWLAFLINRSTGEFNQRFLSNRSNSDCANPNELPEKNFKCDQVHREYRVSDDSVLTDNTVRYEDLFLDWEVEDYGSTIEVKIGDDDYGKSFPTAEGVQNKNPQIKNWSHFILVQEENKSKLVQFSNNYSHDIIIKPLTWKDLTISLREILKDSEESDLWKSWALVFLGFIEQRIFSFLSLGELEKIQSKDSWKYSEISQQLTYYRKLRSANSLSSEEKNQFDGFMKEGVLNYGNYKALIEEFEDKLGGIIEKSLKESEFCRKDNFKPDVNMNSDDISNDDLWYFRGQIQDTDSDTIVNIGLYWFGEENQGYCYGKFKNYQMIEEQMSEFKENGYSVKSDPFNNSDLLAVKVNEFANDRIDLRQIYREILSNLYKFWSGQL